MRDEEISLIFTALGSEPRVRIVQEIGRGPSSGLVPSVLSTLLEIPASTLSFHLSHLVHAGVLKKTRYAKYLAYQIDDGTIQGVLSFLDGMLSTKEDIEEKEAVRKESVNESS